MITRRFPLAICTALTTGALACSSGAPTAVTAPRPPLVRVEVHGAMVAPLKADGAPWDGASVMSPELVKTQTLAIINGPPPPPTPQGWYAFATRCGLALTTAGAVHLERPDPFGFAWLDRGAGFGEQRSLLWQGRAVQDEFAVTWDTVTYEHVVLTDRVLLRVQVTDKDVMRDDPIEIVQITGRDLAVAFEQRGAVVPVPVVQQGNRQLFVVTLAVVPEGT